MAKSALVVRPLDCSSQASQHWNPALIRMARLVHLLVEVGRHQVPLEPDRVSVPCSSSARSAWRCPPTSSAGRCSGRTRPPADHDRHTVDLGTRAPRWARRKLVPRRQERCDIPDSERPTSTVQRHAILRHACGQRIERLRAELIRPPDLRCADRHRCEAAPSGCCRPGP